LFNGYHIEMRCYDDTSEFFHYKRCDVTPLSPQPIKDLSLSYKGDKLKVYLEKLI